MTRVTRHWLGVAIWMGLIFLMSTDLGSSAHTSRIIEPLLRWLHPGISSAALAWAHLLVRKAGHLSEYAILALLLLRAVRTSRGLAPGVWSWKTAGLALLVAAGYAATDEFHQSFVAARTASAGDVLIDSLGALFALMLVFLFRKAGAVTAVRPLTHS